MKRVEMVNFYSAINNLSGDYPVKFAYAISKNKKLILEEIKLIEENKPKISEEYENERIEIIKKNSSKDENGNIIWENENTRKPKIETPANLEKELSELQLKYEKEIEIFNKQLQEHNEFMNEYCEIEIYKIEISDLPEFISQSVMDSIIEMIK